MSKLLCKAENIEKTISQPCQTNWNVYLYILYYSLCECMSNMSNKLHTFVCCVLYYSSCEHMSNMSDKLKILTMEPFEQVIVG